MNEWEWQLLEERVAPESVSVDGVDVRKGDLVRLRPGPGGDIFDLALSAQVAVVESIEQDYEGKIHLAVVLEEDPGKDLGALRQPGHRFFFTPQELEPLRRSPRILVAGIGNIFLGDDAFGVELVRRFSSKIPSVTVRDFGIRSYDLSYALLEDYDVVILVDAAPRGGEPGTLYVIEPDLNADGPSPVPDGHTMNPVSVLQLAKSLGPVTARILLVGCEPADLGGDDGRIGLTEVVRTAADEAVGLVEKLITKILEGGTSASVV